jgi:hypothetical protein
MRVLGENQSAFKSMSKEISFQIEEFSTIDDLLNFFSFEMRLVELLSSTEFGDERAVVTGDDNGASTCL